jgi:hypothetical protein
LGIIKLQ